MNDEIIERELRTWFDAHVEPDVPDSLRRFLVELPRTQAAIHRVERGSPIPAASRRDFALVLLAAVVAVALAASLIAGGLLKSKQPSESPLASGAPSSPGATPIAAGPYRWTLVSSTGEASSYAVGPVLHRADGSLLAIGFGQQARVLTSADRHAWTVEPVDPGLTEAAANHISLVTGVAESGGQIVAVGATALDDISSGDARAWTSTDGVRWQAVPTSSGMGDAEMESVTTGPDGFVAVGSDGFPGGNTQLPGARGAAAWVSSNGLAWTRAPSQASFAGAVMFGVARTSSGYVAWGEIHDAAGSGPSLPPIWTSSDGLHWGRASGIADAGGPGDPIASVVALGDRLVAVGSRRLPESAGSAVVPAIWQSVDGGRTWTPSTLPDESGSNARSGRLLDVGVSGSDLLAVGYLEPAAGGTGGTSATVWRSTDQGATWAALRDEPSFAGSLMSRVIGVDQGFVVFGAADDPNASSNPDLIWLAEAPAAPAPTAVAAPETIRYAGFANGSVGWAVTNRRLVLTDDGGATWRTAGPPVNYAGGAPKGASFFNADHGWVVSEDAFTSSLNLWRTADAGVTWTRTTLPAVADPPETMGDARTVWIDAGHAVIDVAGGMPNGFADSLLFTADGGETWTEPAMRSATAGADGITGIPSFVDSKTGWLAGGAPGSRLWATRDGGETWSLQPLAAPPGYPDDQGEFWGAPTFFDASDGVVARLFSNNQSDALVLYRSSDRGRTWQSLPTAPPATASSWSFPSRADWILWDPYHTTMWRSTDQGGSWSQAPTTGLPSDTAPVMTDELHGWALSTNGSHTIYLTADGGRTWTPTDPTTAPPAPPGPTLGPPPSVPPTQLALTGAFQATFTGMGNPGICGASSSLAGTAVISPEPVAIAAGQFVRVSIWVPLQPGTYAADALIAPNGTPSVQAAPLTNPAGGGGDPPWLAVDGSVTVTQMSDFGQPGRYGVIAGTVDATLRHSGSPDLHLSGAWGCVDASQVGPGG